MAINLQKGQRIGIDLSNISIGLGWNPNESSGYDFDLDASAFMLNQSKIIPCEEFFVFYGNTDSPDGALKHSGDDTTGKSSDEGDDETINIDFSTINPEIEEIIFVVTIHQAIQRKQNFGQVKNSYIRIVNNQTLQEIAKYELDEDFSIETAIEFGRLYKKNGTWKFEASGIGHRQDLSFFVEKYYKGEIIK